MKLAHDIRDIATSGVLETARATIKATRKVFSFFSDNVYANKKIAIVRELVANAVDAHLVAGKADVPIELWLPTEIDPSFRVKDRGTGMSHNFAMSGYMAFADGSTKDDNDLVIGGFGIGKAAVFSYVDQYSLRSVHEGVVSLYSVFKDAEGVPSIALLAQATTDEDNGVEISFAVELVDAAGFEEASSQALRYFTPLPIVYNAADGRITPPSYLSSGTLWGMREQPGPLNIIMGGICYPVETSSLGWDLRYDDRLAPLLSYGLDIRLPIGACDIALSREALSYTARTIDAVRDGLGAVIDEVSASFSTMFDHHDTLWAAKAALATELGMTPSASGSYYSRNSRSRFLQDNAVYRGARFDVFARAHSLTAKWEIPARHRKRGQAVITSTRWSIDSFSANPLMVETIIIDDLPITSRSRTVQRIKLFAETAPRNGDIIVFRTLDAAKLLEELGHPPHILTSTLPVPAAVQKTRTSRPLVRLFRYDGRRSTRYGDAVTSLNPGIHGGNDKGVCEIPYKDQPSSGILVTMSQFELPRGLHDMVATGLLAWDELHFANVGDATKLRHWPRVETVFRSRLRDALDNCPDLGMRLALAREPVLKPLFGFIRQHDLHRTLTDRQARTPFGRICQLYAAYVAPLTNDQQRLAPFVTKTLPKRLEPAKLVERFEHKQPGAHLMLKLLLDNPRAHDAISLFKDLL